VQLYANVCAGCFEDPDLRNWIEDRDGDPGCDFCGQHDFPTASFDDLIEFIGERIKTFYSQANENLSYDSGEGGYQGITYDTWDILFDAFELDLPRDEHDQLRTSLVEPFNEFEPWCEYDPARLDDDESMIMDWERFAQVVMYERRFFFHAHGETDRHDWDDSLSPRELLRAIARNIDGRSLVRAQPPGFQVFRARRRRRGQRFTTAAELGPPPRNRALQSNRMNPPGIPMFYGAENGELAIAETRARRYSLGRFETTRKIRILDLAELPKTPGVFSTVGRDDIMAMRFLHAFSRIIIAPVEHEERTVLDYIPTQVFTEFLRDFKLEGGRIHGIRYGSATGVAGANVVLFATQEDVSSRGREQEKTLLRFTGAEHGRLSTRR
jgi:hypothetical protein